MLSSSFDITILGTDLPALIFGALAAKKNYRVLVIGQGGHNNAYDIRGLRFVSRAQLLFGLHSSVFISDCFGDLALGPEIRNRPKSLDPIAQLVMPGVRLDLPVSTEVFDRELKREFPNVADRLSRLIEQELQAVNKGFEAEMADFPIIPSRNIKDSLSRRGLGGRLQEIAEPFRTAFDSLSPDPKAVVAMNAMAAGLALSPVPPGGPAQARLLWHLRNGLVHIDWGLDELRNIFIGKIKQNAGEVRTKESVDSVSTNWKGTINKLVLANSGDEIGTSLVVMGMDPVEMPDLLPEGRKAQGLREDFKQIKPSHYLFTLNLGMPASNIPDAMARVVFNVLDPKKPIEGDNFLIIQRNAAMVPLTGQAGNKDASLTVSAFMPADAFDHTIDSLSRFGRLVMDALCRDVMPFLDVDHAIQSISSVHQKSASKNSEKEAFFIDSRSLLPIFQCDNEKGLGLFTISVHTRYKNLLNLSNEVTGALGFEGAFYTAREALKITQGLIKLRSVS